MLYYLRVHLGNDGLDDDAVASPLDRVADISFGVPSHVKSAVEKKMQEDLESDLFPYNLVSEVSL